MSEDSHDRVRLERALRRLALSGATRAAGADDGGAMSDAMSDYTGAVGDIAFGASPEPSVTIGEPEMKFYPDHREGKKRGGYYGGVK